MKSRRYHSKVKSISSVKGKWEIVIDNVQALLSNVLVIAQETHIQNCEYSYPKSQKSKHSIYTTKLQAVDK